MPNQTNPPAAPLSWKFPRTFWVANGAELLERAAYYGMAIALAVYLTRQIGFDDVATGWVAAGFASVLYLLPTFTGIMADRMGFRRALILAFALLAIGYALLGLAGLRTGVRPESATSAPTATSLAAEEAAAIITEEELFFSPLPRKLIAVLALAVIMFGGSIVKPVISGTVAKCSDEAHRARAFSIFYAMVNIGAFTGKFVAAPLRTGFTVPGTDVHLALGLDYINYYAALMALLAAIFVARYYRNPDIEGQGKTYREALRGLLHVLGNFRFMVLIVIIAGFWTIQHQLYASMPKYILRMLGESAKPEWLANINPLVVVILVVPITHLVRGYRAVNTIAISLTIIPLSALTVALSPLFASAVGGNQVNLGFAVAHPITVMVILGIGLQGVAECFLSPKWLEFASKQAPPGETGLYMGYMHLSSFFAYFLGFVISGYLLDAFCPEPTTLPAAEQAQRLAAIAGHGPMPAAYAHAYYIWLVFAAIGFAALLALLLFRVITERIDRAR